MAFRLLLVGYIFWCSAVFSQSNQLISNENKIGNLAKEVLPDSVSYFSWMSGPSLGGELNQLDENGDVQDNSLNTWNQVSLRWNTPNKNFQFVINNPFIINHNPSSEDETYVLEDSWFGIRGLWFKSGNLSFFGTIDTFTPLTQLPETREEKVLFNPGGFQILNYQVNNRFSFGGWLWFRAYIYGRRTIEEDNRSDFLIAPTATYKVNDWYSISTFYRFNGESKRSYKMIVAPDDSINLKQAFKINKYLTIEPFMTLFRQSNYSLEKGNLNVWLSGTLF